MDRDHLLRLVVACGLSLVALACIATSAWLEFLGRPTPPFIAGLAGTALGFLPSLLAGMRPPASSGRRSSTARKKKATPP